MGVNDAGGSPPPGSSTRVPIGSSDGINTPGEDEAAGALAEAQGLYRRNVQQMMDGDGNFSSARLRDVNVTEARGDLAALRTMRTEMRRGGANADQLLEMDRMIGRMEGALPTEPPRSQYATTEAGLGAVTGGRSRGGQAGTRATGPSAPGPSTPAPGTRPTGRR